MDMLSEMYIESDIYSLTDSKETTNFNEKNSNTLPEDYCEFMTTYGSGTINEFFYVLTPNEISKTTEEWKDTLTSDFWQNTSDFTFDMQKESYILGYTIDSDLFVIHPKVEEIYCLPRNDDQIYPTGKTFYDLLHWIKSSGILVEEFSTLHFRPIGETSLLRYKIDNPHDLDELLKSLNILGEPDKILDENEGYKLFYRQYGLRIDYLPMYNYLMANVDKKYINIVYEKINSALTELGFIITEKNNI